MKLFYLFIVASVFLSGCTNVGTTRAGNLSGSFFIKGKIEVQSRYFSDSLSAQNSVLTFNVVDAFREQPTSAFFICIENEDSSVYFRKVLRGSSFQTKIPPGKYNIMIAIASPESAQHLTNFEIKPYEVVNIYTEIGGSGVY